MRLPLTVELEDVGKAAGNFFLKFLEYCFKVFALLAAGIAVATPGLFSEKLGAAFSGLSQALRQTVALPGELMEMGIIIQDFNVQTASDFAATHGNGAVGNLLFDLNRVVEYAVSVHGSITGSFFSTVGAAFLAFMAFYILATVLRFARQKGQGSYLVQLERKLGDRIFFQKTDSGCFFFSHARFCLAIKQNCQDICLCHAITNRVCEFSIVAEESQGIRRKRGPQASFRQLKNGVQANLEAS